MESEVEQKSCTELIDFPKLIENRPGLSKISYRIGAYNDFRSALMNKLSKNIILENWTHRNSDDPGIALLEGASIICDILTFYQEVYANESKLRTAKWRESIVDLVRLTGYRLSPGLGGKAIFELETNGSNPIEIKAGYPIKAEIEGLEGKNPVDFESSEDFVAYPWLSKFNLYWPLKQPAVTEETSNFIINSSREKYASESSVKEGDRLIICDLPHNLYQGRPSAPIRNLVNSEMVIVDKVKKLHGWTCFSIKGHFQKRRGAKSKVVAFKVGRAFHHFGFNAPKNHIELPPGTDSAKSTRISYIRSLSEPTEDGSSVDSGNKSDRKLVSKPKIILDPPLLSELDFPLDREVPDLSAGTLIIIRIKQILAVNQKNRSGMQDSSEHTFLRTIYSARSSSMTWGSVSAPATVVSLKSGEELTLISGSQSAVYAADIRDIEFLEVLDDQLTLKAMPVLSSITESSMLNLNTLLYKGSYEQAKALENRRVLIAPSAEQSFYAKIASVKHMTSFDGIFCELILDELPQGATVKQEDFPHEKPETVVYGNLISATQGKSSGPVVLGNGDNRKVFQTFKLPKAPLTYLIAPAEDPPCAPEIDVFVNNRLWKRVTSLVDKKLNDEVYIIRQDITGDSWVQFGDGQTGGSRLPSGQGNVVARFRTGAGAHGILKKDTTVKGGKRVEHLEKIQLLDAVTGGTNPESGDKARAVAPGKTQSLGRIVSLRDFESEAGSIAGVSKVSARWGLKANVPTVILTVLMESGRDKEIKEVQEKMRIYDKSRGMQRCSIEICSAKVSHVILAIDFGYDMRYQLEIVEKAIIQALGASSNRSAYSPEGLFGIYNRDFGGKEYTSRIEGTIQNVPGVVWVKITGVKIEGLATNDSFDNEIPCPQDALLSLCLKDVTFNPMPEIVRGESGE